jgi:hypothetical protein
MNYLKIYCNLIRKAEKRGYTKKKAKEQGMYVEEHHIFPVSIFGKNKRIVCLTAREHYIAHALLEKICISRYGIEHWKSKKMIYAFWSMNMSQKSKRKNTINSYLYEKSKQKVSLLVSNAKKGNTYMLGKTLSEEARKKVSEGNKGNKKWLGKTHTEETKKKIGDFHRGKIMSKESRLKMSKSHTNKTSPAKGKIWSEEQKKNLIEIRKNQSKYTWKITHPDGKIDIVKSLNNFCVENNLDCSSMCKVSNKKMKSYKGFDVEKI